MNSFTATEARAKWFELLKKSITGHKIFEIRSKEGDVVLMSRDEYESLIETLELMSVPGMVKSVRGAKKEMEEGKYHSSDEVFGD